MSLEIDGKVACLDPEQLVFGANFDSHSPDLPATPSGFEEMHQNPRTFRESSSASRASTEADCQVLF